MSTDTCLQQLTLIDNLLRRLNFIPLLNQVKSIKLIFAVA